MSKESKTEKQFFIENTRRVNLIMVNTLIWCALAPIALFVLSFLGFFDFGKELLSVIGVVGFAVTIVPYLLHKLKVKDNFLKYYMLAAIGTFIGIVGMDNDIGIYMTFLLVPIASCLYIDKWFTVRIGIMSYFIMALSVYVNAAGKLEVQYKNWSHMLTFRNYLIGFTIEYLVCMLFLFRIVKRAQEFLMSQQDSLTALEEENEKQKRISKLYDNTLSVQRKSSLNKILDNTSTMAQEDYAKLVAGHQFVAGLQEELMYAPDFDNNFIRILGKVGEYFNLDRIMYIEPAIEEGQCKLSYQWARYQMDEIKDFYSMISDEEYNRYAEIFNEYGCIEFYKADEDYEKKLKKIDCAFTRYDIKIMLGSQIWIPILVATKYNGIICFDRNSTGEYSLVEKYLLPEVAGILASHVTRINADNANRAKSAFLSSMSHEIRTPMNAILGMTQVALREDMNPKVKKSLNIIKSSAEGLLGIINDILDFSKIESGKIDIIPENYTILSMINDLKTITNARNLEKGLDIIYNIPDNLPLVMQGDAVRIKQVMVNLATNAVKYTDKGSVTISISTSKINDKELMLHYEVKDTGRGIREEDKGKLFQSFSQIDQKHNHHVEGTGLGLAISKQLVELMGGKIGLESKFMEGSTFFFDVPQIIIDETPAGNPDEYDYNVKNENEIDFQVPDASVLIVDDNEINLMVAETLFEPFGMKIMTADSGVSALELIKNNYFDIIFMDNYMPEMDGIETTHEIRAMQGNPNQNVPIIALTADAIMGVKEKLIAEGMNDFLAKPIELKEVSRILKTYL